MQPGYCFLSCSGQWPGIFVVLLLITAEKAIDRVKQERSQQAIIRLAEQWAKSLHPGRSSAPGQNRGGYRSA